MAKLHDVHPDLQEEWIPRIANGEMMSLAFTEPGGGADAGNIKTKAVKLRHRGMAARAFVAGHRPLIRHGRVQS